MPIFYPDVLSQKSEPRAFTYTDKDVRLYALSIGLGGDPLDERELDFVYERKLKVVPTAATVLATANGGFWNTEPDPDPALRISSVNRVTVLHGEQKVELPEPLPTSGSFRSEGGYIAAFDKGVDKGAVLINQTNWTDDRGRPVATLTSTAFARSDGGFGGPREGQPRPHAVPTRAPDKTVQIATRPDQCAIYRLNGDTNPLHIDPEAARASGFDRPILHGLCTYGLTCRAVLQGMLNYDAAAVRSHQLRWSSPVFPGDVLTVDLWRDGKEVSFEARVIERGVHVVRNGLTVLR